ncbi:MAG TPA: hypothetical protein PKC87_01840 [Candidatus Absconditabacterales bacterium]|nr:hypothetical protein [Candidatus Absconditabacterales bacterium]
MDKQEIVHQERVLLRIKKELEPLKKEETEARRLWTLGYKKNLSAVRELNERRKKNLTTDILKGGIVNKTVQTLWEILDGWDEKSEELTRRRDAARSAMESKKEEIIKEEQLLSELLYEYQLQLEQGDAMIAKVFLLNDGVVSALENMDKYLSTEVFPQLHAKGTQKTIENSLMTKRVVIMTNSITFMDISKVEEAKGYIDAFFARINPDRTIQPEDDTVAMLSELLKELLVVKIKVKAGPNLSKFLALELSEEKFPELKKAQRLLASATNYVRSGQYVRLFTRVSKDDVWQPVRQS